MEFQSKKSKDTLPHFPFSPDRTCGFRMFQVLFRVFLLLSDFSHIEDEQDGVWFGTLLIEEAEHNGSVCMLVALVSTYFPEQVETL